MTLEKKVLPLLTGIKPQPFDHESGAVTTELSPFASYILRNKSLFKFESKITYRMLGEKSVNRSKSFMTESIYLCFCKLKGRKS